MALSFGSLQIANTVEKTVHVNSMSLAELRSEAADKQLRADRQKSKEQSFSLVNDDDTILNQIKKNKKSDFLNDMFTADE